MLEFIGTWFWLVGGDDLGRIFMVDERQLVNQISLVLLGTSGRKIWARTTRDISCNIRQKEHDLIL